MRRERAGVAPREEEQPNRDHREPGGLCPVLSLCLPALFAPLSREEVLKTVGPVRDLMGRSRPGVCSMVQVCLPEGTIGFCPRMFQNWFQSWFMTSGTCFRIRFSGGSVPEPGSDSV